MTSDNNGISISKRLDKFESHEVMCWFVSLSSYRRDPTMPESMTLLKGAEPMRYASAPAQSILKLQHDTDDLTLFQTHFGILR